MKFINNNRATPYFVSVINITLVCSYFIAVINRTYPILGHDYAYFISHTFDTYLHYRINGFSIQWYTPSFGGGLPAYANPQHMQFSLIQFLVFAFDPLTSVYLAIIIYISTGIICFYIFAQQIVGLDWRASLLGTLFFVVTGFYIGHMISGQVGFMAYPLLSAIILLLFWKRWSDVLSGTVIALLISSLIYQAGFYTVVIFILACAITLPLLYLFNSNLFSFPNLIKRSAVAIIFTIFLSASKLYAVQTFMRYFPREITSENSHSLLSAIGALITGLLGTTTLAPLMAIFRQDINSLPLLLYSFVHYEYSGLWETDLAISPVLIGIFLMTAFKHLRTRQKITIPKLPKDKLIAVLLLTAATWFSLEYTLAKGWLYWMASQLPILKSLHFSFRFTAIFYFPLALLGALIVDGWFKKRNGDKANSLFVLLNIATLIFPLSYFLYTADVHYRLFDITSTRAAYQESQSGSTFPVTYIADQNTKDWYAIPLGATTQKPYEPIFGYKLEVFKPLTHPGSVFEINNGYFNMTNPVSLTFPEANGGKLFSLFKAADQTRLEQFVQRRQPDWHIPRIQIILDYVSGIAFLITFCIILLSSVSMSKAKSKP